MTLKRLLCGTTVAALSLGAAHAFADTANGGGASAGFATYTALFARFSAHNSGDNFSFEGVGSSLGQSAFINNTISSFENLGSGILTYGTIAGTTVHFGVSEAPLTSSSGVSNTGAYTGTNASSTNDGPLIQVPALGSAVTIAFNESGETGTLTLTDSQVCGVLSGHITEWHSLVPAITNHGIKIAVAYRSDGSGTTFVLTQHLNAVCASTPYTFPNLEVTKTFANLFTGGTIPATFTAETGSGNVAKYLTSTANSLGYISPDYTSIAPGSANTTSLAVASLVNNGVAYAPTVANIETGLANPGAGASDSTPPSTLSTAEDPYNWVPQLPVVTSGYPIVGYSSFDLSTCYHSATVGGYLISFLNDLYNSATYATIIENNGFVPLSSSAATNFTGAVTADFLTNSSGYGLNIDGSSCAGLSGR